MALARADIPKRFRVKDEYGPGTVRFNAAGTWNYLSGAGMSAQVVPLSEMSHDGNQVVRIDFTDASTGGYFGLNGAAKLLQMPPDWNGEFCAVVNFPNAIPNPVVDPSYADNIEQTQVCPITSMNLYLKNSADTYSNALLRAAVTYNNWAYSGWRAMRWRVNATQNVTDSMSAARGGTVVGTTYPIGPGLGQPPSFFNNAQIRFIKTAGAGTACSVYVALMGVPARARPQLLLTFDGGYIGQYTNFHLANMARANRPGYSPVPYVIGIQKDLIASGAVTHMSVAQMQEIDASGYGTICVYSKLAGGGNKGAQYVGTPFESTSVGQLGVARWLQYYDEAAAWLTSLGIRTPTLFHPYPEGDNTDELMRQLILRGVKLARTANKGGFRTNYTAEVGEGRQLLLLDSTNAITPAETVAGQLAILDEEIANGGNAVTLCHQVTADGDTSAGWEVGKWMSFLDGVQDRVKQGKLDVPSVAGFANGMTNPRNQW